MDTIQQWLQSRWFFWLRILQFIAAMIIFAVAALMPSGYVKIQQPDYTMHFIGNVLLFLSASVATYGRLKLGLLIIFLVSYSILIELAQRLAPGRHVDVQDMMFNILGLLAGLVIVWLTEWSWRRLSANLASPNK